MVTRIWHNSSRPGLGFLATLSGIIASAEDSNPGLIPNLRTSSGLIVASDYGGEHKTAKWASYSYVITNRDAAAQWVPQIRDVRKRLLPDGRRMSFKRLGDNARMRALGEFLSAANGLCGLSVSFLVHWGVLSLFASETPHPANLGYEPLSGYPPHIAEKLLRVTHLLALLVAGTSAPGQDVLWITDQDAIAPNVRGLHLLTDVVGRAAGSVLDHDMGHLRVATTKSDPGDLSLEDLVAIPDFAAGLLPSHLAAVLGDRGAPSAGLFLPRSDQLSPNNRELLDWFSDNTQVLQRLVILIDVTEADALRGTRLRYHGTRDLQYGGRSSALPD